jgi:hypothetical protein
LSSNQLCDGQLSRSLSTPYFDLYGRLAARPFELPDSGHSWNAEPGKFLDVTSANRQRFRLYASAALLHLPQQLIPESPGVARAWPISLTRRAFERAEREDDTRAGCYGS